ncbi:MAG: hypothetical protein HOH43_01400 [Candidatus Latescibacteria bacterium]|jgi:hypothetical protein|nr:hypothetical protein [Candidatus Latescibacterota bacterium]
MRRIYLSIWLVTAFMVLTQFTVANAWWEKGHRIIAANAAAVLPQEMPEFFRGNAATLVRLSVQPDMWKEFGTELRRSESPDHYLDVEYLAPSPSEFEFQRDRYVAMRKINKTMDPARVGMLPYRILEDFQKLRGAFAQHRKDPSNTSIQQEVLFYAGTMGHYAGDTAQPLHLTIHYDGRVDSKGSVKSAKGIHSLFEGEFVRDHIEQQDSAPFVPAPERYEDLRHAIRQAFTTSFAEIDRVYNLEAAGQLKNPDSQTLEFGRRRLAHGSSFLASLWYTAWVGSKDLDLPDR